MFIGWKWFSKKYWKKFLMLIVLSTVSTISFLLLARNSAERIYSLLRCDSKETNSKYIFYSFSNKPLLNFGENWKAYLLFVIVFIIISCFLTALSYYHRDYLVHLVSNNLKQKSISKLYRLEEKVAKEQEKRTFGVVCYQSKELGSCFVFLPDNLYIFLLTTVFIFFELKSFSGFSVWAGLVYFLLTSLLSLGFNYLVNRRKTELQRVVEKQTETENSLITNRKLIIKKGLVNKFFRNYWQISLTVQKKTSEEVFFSSLYKSVFSYLIRFGKFFLLLIVLIFVSSASDFVIFTMFTKLTTSFGYLVKGVRKYPHYSSTQKRFNYFLNLPEKNDIQKNILISEPITSVVLQRISFFYEKNKPFLRDYTLVFEKGKINRLQAPNGFGKTTIIDLLFGFYQPAEGKIIVNGEYRLSEINLKEWRKKIAYAEYANLVKSNLSSGQRQLIDLQNTLQKDNKEIFIFDEADNALDENNKKEFRQKIEKISKKKLVILVSC